MRFLPLLVLPAFLCAVPTVPAQSAADQATLQDLKTASKQMSLESEGAPPFRLTASYQAFDFLGRPESQGRWTEEFGRPGFRHRELHDSNAVENYAPEDQANIGATPPNMSGTFVQQFLIASMLHPGPSDAMLDHSKLSFKTQKIGAVALRCVILEPIDAKNAYMRRLGTRAYCLAQDAPMIRLVEGAYGILVTYNSMAHFGTRLFAQQITAQQRGHQRGTLQVSKMVSAPELATAPLPEAPPSAPADSERTGAVKVGSAVTAGRIVVTKVTPVYPESAKQKHISGQVVLHAVISKEGTIEALEVISAPSDDLAESAVEAVSQWRYQPYLLNGQPTEVDTTITVNYSFG